MAGSGERGGGCGQCRPPLEHWSPHKLRNAVMPKPKPVSPSQSQNSCLTEMNAMHEIYILIMMFSSKLFLLISLSHGSKIISYLSKIYLKIRNHESIILAMSGNFLKVS